MFLLARVSKQQLILLAVASPKQATQYHQLVDQFSLELRYRDKVSQAEWASFSRALRRLSERGYLIRYPRSRIHASQAGLPLCSLPERQQTMWVVLTKKGQKAHFDIWRQSKDSRCSFSLNSVSPPENRILKQE